jgi:hypothetical protein
MAPNRFLAKPAQLRNRKEPPAPLPLSKKLRVPLTEREAARLDPRQITMWEMFSPTASSQAPGHGSD